MKGTREELASLFAELMANVVGRMRTFSLEWPYEELTQTQVKTLMLLGEGRQAMRKISVSLGVVLSSATRILDSLVKRGLVERTEDSEDRRRVLCSLTEDGRIMLTRVWKIDRKRAESVAELLDKESLGQVIHSLELLQEAMTGDGEDSEKVRKSSSFASRG